ncbi:hypothetical protein PENTCL1PPCAC_24806, partial [Pristionchus entomophagus]
LLTLRKRKCDRCGAQSSTVSTFPANAKNFLQRLWVNSLGLDPASTTLELNKFRERLDRKEDIRWCEKHFDDNGMPKKVVVPLIYPFGEQLHYINNLRILYTQSTPPRHVSVSQLLIDDRASEIRSVKVSRFNSGLSSVPTMITKESSYRPSQNSQPTESDEEEEDEEEVGEDSVRSAYFLTDKSKLELLFRRCQECGAQIDPISLAWTQLASALSVT